MATKKIFITGVAGFLGSHLADAFLKLGYTVAGCDNFIGGYKDNLSPEIEFHECDCVDFERMKTLLAGVDIVYHCAATAYEGLSVFAPNFITQNIVQASVSMMSASIASGVKRFIYCSSMARYGENQVPFTEDMIPRPQDPYGIGKYSGELFLKNLSEVHGMEYVIMVPHNIIGPRQKYDDPYRNVASIMINRMLQGKQPVVYGDGEQMRCFSFIQDDIDILLIAAEAPQAVGEIINIGPDHEFVSINTLATTIADLLQFPLDPIHVPGRPQEVKLANCSADKARKLFDYQPKTSLRDGLSAMIDYIRTRGPKPFEYHIGLEILTPKTPKTWSEKIF